MNFLHQGFRKLSSDRDR